MIVEADLVSFHGRALRVGRVGGLLRHGRVREITLVFTGGAPPIARELWLLKSDSAQEYAG